MKWTEYSENHLGEKVSLVQDGVVYATGVIPSKMSHEFKDTGPSSGILTFIILDDTHMMKYPFNHKTEFRLEDSED